MLTSKYQDLRLIVGGDKNKMDISEILRSNNSLQQIVTRPTHKSGRILVIIITNMQHYYNNPQYLSPVQPDNPSEGRPSDHLALLGVPHTDPQYPLQDFTKLSLHILYVTLQLETLEIGSQQRIGWT